MRNKNTTSLVGFKVPQEEKWEIQEDAERAGFNSVAAYLRSAWRLAKSHPELLAEVKDAEHEYQLGRGKNRWNFPLRTQEPG